MARGLSPDTAAAFRLGVVIDPASGHEAMVGRLCIPSIGPNGIYQLKFRCMADHDCKEIGHAKYLTDAQDNRLFNLRALITASPFVCITEGEIDAIVLVQLGLPAVAAPGASSFRRHHARLFAGFSKVYIWGDGDSAGKGFAKGINTALKNGVMVHCPDGEDVNSLLVSGNRQKIFHLMGMDDNGTGQD
jgi:hypothetical protein